MKKQNRQEPSFLPNLLDIVSCSAPKRRVLAYLSSANNIDHVILIKFLSLDILARYNNVKLANAKKDKRINKQEDNRITKYFISTS